MTTGQRVDIVTSTAVFRGHVVADYGDTVAVVIEGFAVHGIWFQWTDETAMTVNKSAVVEEVGE